MSAQACDFLEKSAGVLFASAMLLLVQGAAATDSAMPQETGYVLQVTATHLVLRAEPAADATIIADSHRGQLLHADRRQGDWFRVPAAGGYGWMHLEPAAYGEMSLAILATESVTASTDATAGDDIRHDAVTGRQLEASQPLMRPDQVPPPEAAVTRESVPVPDRWRIMQALDYRFSPFDPYHQNVLKGDLPLAPASAPEWFFTLGLVSDTTLEKRRLPTPVPPQTSSQPGTLDVFGGSDQSTVAENIILSLGMSKGDTTFRPPDYEFRFVPVFNFNRSRADEERALRVDPSSGTVRSDNFTGIQELFADMHLRNVSERFDFDSLRVGIQPLTLDFRGFLFQDNALGIRLFGNRDNNRWQYNAGWMRRLEKDTNSGLNDLGQPPRRDDLFFANLYRQDFPVAGFTSELVLVHDRNHEAGPDYYDSNGFLIRPAVIGDVRPHNYHVTYLGYSGDGHFGRYGLSGSAYAALGRDERNPFSQTAQDIQAWFAAAELARDFDWLRLRGNFLYASGDRDPYNGTESGFDSILENPQFAGADTSFFIRQAIPLIGGGGVTLSGRNGLLPDLRSSKDQGQSNFVNPGLTLVGAGADADVLPTLRLLGNVSLLRFNETEILGVLRNQAPPARDIGTDISAGLQFRPLYSQNVVVTASFAALLPGKGLRELYDESRSLPLYSALLNVILAY